MKIEIVRSFNDNHREVGFFDFEDEDVIAYSGLLNRDDAAAFAVRLRDVAHELASWAQQDGRDDGQILLPIFIEGVAA